MAAVGPRQLLRRSRRVQLNGYMRWLLRVLSVSSLMRAVAVPPSDAAKVSIPPDR